MNVNFIEYEHLARTNMMGERTYQKFTFLFKHWIQVVFMVKSIFQKET
jgi:hypothetical protein